MNVRWVNPLTPKKLVIDHLKVVLGVDENIANLLVNRGVSNFEEAKSFFRPSLDDLHDPYLMKDMKKAVQRLLKAIERNEKIMVYGDYDVDGTTAVSLLFSFLKTHSKNICSYIPDRYEEGYGISLKGIDVAENRGVGLIVALDCGIKAMKQVSYAAQKGIDFIICDHHTPGEKVPDAHAILNPKQESCKYPYKELCGCGVGFKLIQAIGLKIGLSIHHLKPYLDLVAIAIAADIVPVNGENRILAFHGLQVINSSPRIGIQAILHQVKKHQLNISDVVFKIAPRINAAGRIKHASFVIDLLTAKDLETALIHAKEIEAFNQQRKLLDSSTAVQALAQIKEQSEENRASTVVFNEAWHKGVIGIVASRLIETYHRPTLVFTKSKGYLVASARSVKGFDVYQALEQCSEYIAFFGGHKYAAGLSIEPENYQKFKAKFETVVSETLPLELKAPSIVIDAMINLDEITPKFIRVLKQFEPFGPGNMNPVFCSTGLKDDGNSKTVGADRSHLKLRIAQQENHQKFNAIGFGMGNKETMLKDKQLFKSVYNIGENEWNGQVSIQLEVKDMKEEKSSDDL